jgi:hypothetical protein
MKSRKPNWLKTRSVFKTQHSKYHTDIDSIIAQKNGHLLVFLEFFSV